MPWWVIRFGPYVAVFAVALGLGWQVNGWRLNAKISELTASHAEELAKAQAKARAAEQAMQDAADKLRRDHDAKVRDITNRLNATLAELRKRPKRPASKPTTTPNPGPATQGCSGAQLYREDSEFLAREAARADLIRQGYVQCQQQYEAVRKGTAKP